MKKRLALWSTGILLACMTLATAATSVRPKPLDEMVREADLVVVATIKAVGMVDGNGRPIKDRRARTGPVYPVGFHRTTQERREIEALLGR